MSIIFNSNTKIFNLSTQNTTYAFEIFDERYLVHLYYGQRATIDHGFHAEDFNSFSPNPNYNNKTYSLDTLPLEFSSFGNSDYRTPAIQLEFEEGSKITDFVYERYEVLPYKTKLRTLPSSNEKVNECSETLVIHLKDSLRGVRVELHYSLFEETDVLTKTVYLYNDSDESLVIQTLSSHQIDFDHNNFDLIHLTGAWARERDLIRTPINRSTHLIESKRGASSHHQNPFVALVSPNADEAKGDVYAFNIVYSGSFRHVIEVNPYGFTRVTSGLNPFNFNWLLKPHTFFESPEVIMTYSPNGLNAMSQNMHHFVKQNILNGEWANKERPLLINNWEATYFDFNEVKLKNIIDAARVINTELFVLDDGWFGKRNSDASGLGDWFVNSSKLPSGIEGIAKYANSKGLQFGLWFEPEMISEDSELFRAHPEYVLHVPGRPQTEGRNQRMLDLSKSEVVDYLYHTLSKILSESPIAYVKWDFNRNMTEVFNTDYRQGEVEHRYYLGLYQLILKLVSDFPKVLFESCSGGGGRFDLGMLCYMPQTWTSDNTDALARLKIQYATSLAYPILTLGAHISDVPNHQTGRSTSLEFRAHVAMSGNLGLELDASKLDDSEKNRLCHINMFYKKYRYLIQFGAFHRILSPFDSEITSWGFVDEHQTEGLLFAFRALKTANQPLRKIKCPFINTDVNYEVKLLSILDGKSLDTRIFHGSELKFSGLNMPHHLDDFFSCCWHIKSL